MVIKYTIELKVYGNTIKYAGIGHSRLGNSAPVTGRDLRAAIAVLNGREVNPDQKPSMGCSIKWKA